MTTYTKTELSPQDVLDVLARHILVDGYHVVMDLERSRGSYLYDARSDRMLLDFFTNFATYPVGYNHPKTADPEYREKLLQAALGKPTNSDTYTTLYAEFVETFSRLAVPATHSRHLFFVEGGSLAVENALKAAFDWKVRKNMARGITDRRGRQILHFRHAFHGRSGYSISLTNTADPRKTDYFPTFDWPRLTCPRLSFPLTPEIVRDTAAAEERVEQEIREACARFPGDIAALISSRSRERAGQPLPARVLLATAPAGRRARIPPHLRRGPDWRGPDRNDVGFRAVRRGARPLLLRQENSGVRVCVEPPDRRGRQCLFDLVANQLHLGRKSGGHGALREYRDHRGRKAHDHARVGVST